MTPWVVDASVAVKWFLPELHSEAANRVLTSKRELLAPDLIWAEVGNTLWKRFRRNEITLMEAEGILKDFMRFPLETYAAKALLDAAWSFASQLGISVYDALYFALAAGRNCSLVTADRKLYDSSPKNSFGTKLIWIEDVA